MTVYEIHPQSDPRWPALLESHPNSSVFHTSEWMDALYRTYNYIAKVYTTSPPDGPLTNGIAFCHVDSWLTGSRLVSLPFSDHCEPLVDNAKNLEILLAGMQSIAADRFKFAEIRPRSTDRNIGYDFLPHTDHVLHMLDLQPGIEELYSRLHKSSVQRKIQRAARERIVVDQGRSGTLLKEFYELLLLTRRRHGLPPQPFAWFRNLVECMGTRLTIHMARVDGRPIASILTLRHKQTIVYKYGCSDVQFHSMGGMPLLFWQAIQEAKLDRLQEFDLGRTEQSNTGLLRFKDQLGAGRTTLRYWRLSAQTPGRAGEVLQSKLPQRVLSHLPGCFFRLAGEIFYRHAG